MSILSWVAWVILCCGLGWSTGAIREDFKSWGPAAFYFLIMFLAIMQLTGEALS